MNFQLLEGPANRFKYFCIATFIRVVLLCQTTVLYFDLRPFNRRSQLQGLQRLIMVIWQYDFAPEVSEQVFYTFTISFFQIAKVQIIACNGSCAVMPLNSLAC